MPGDECVYQWNASSWSINYFITTDTHSYSVIWWCHGIEKLATILALYEGNLPVTSGLTSQMSNNSGLWFFSYRWNKRCEVSFVSGVFHIEWMFFSKSQEIGTSYNIYIYIYVHYINLPKLIIWGVYSSCYLLLWSHSELVLVARFQARSHYCVQLMHWFLQWIPLSKTRL